MTVSMTKIDDGRNVAVVYNGSVIDVYDDKIRVLVSNHYPTTYIDISKDIIIDIFRKYCLPDKELEKYVENKVFEMTKSESIKEDFEPTL